MGMRRWRVDAKQVDHAPCQFHYSGRVQNPLFDERGFAVALHGQIIGNTHIAGDTPGNPICRDMTDARVNNLQGRFIGFILAKNANGSTADIAKAGQNFNELFLAVSGHTSNTQDLAGTNIE